MILKFQNLITYSNDLVIIQVGYIFKTHNIFIIKKPKKEIK